MPIIAVCSIIRKNGKVLITQRSSKEVYPNMYDLPGGQLNHMEDIADGIKREVMEESNLNIDVLFPVDVVSRNINGKHIILITYVSNYKSGKIKLSKEHQSFKWVKPEDAIKIENMTPLTKHAIQVFLDSPTVKQLIDKNNF